MDAMPPTVELPSQVALHLPVHRAGAQFRDDSGCCFAKHHALQPSRSLHSILRREISLSQKGVLREVQISVLSKAYYTT